MSYDNIQNRIREGTFWAYIQNWIAKGLSLLVFFVLARILNPTEFGVFAIATVFLSLSEILLEQGLSHSIVQKQVLDADHINTAFTATLILGITITIGSLTLASPISRLFSHNEIARIIKGLSPVFLLMSLSCVPAAILRRNLEYKVLATRSLFANTCSGIGAIIAAIHGEGVWTFVYQQLIYHLVSTFVLWKNETWRPKLFISLEYLKEMAGFSSQIVAGKLFEFLEMRLTELVVGHQYGISVLGQYSLANRAFQAMSQLIAAPMWDASISAFSRAGNDPKHFTDLFLKFIRLAIATSVPLYIFCFIISNALLPIVFGQKWLPSAPFFAILSLLGAIRAIIYIFGIAIQSKGNATAGLIFGFSRLVITLFAFFALTKILGTNSIVYAQVIGQISVVPVILYVFKKQNNNSLIDFYKPLAKPINLLIIASVITTTYAFMFPNGLLLNQIIEESLIFFCIIGYSSVTMFFIRKHKKSSHENNIF